MKTVLICVLFTGILMPDGGASDLTDAILDVDPRASLRSGRGVTYDSAYGDADESSPTAAEEPDPLQTPSLRGQYDYGQAYKGLRSPLYEPSRSASSMDEEAIVPTEPEDSFSTTVPTTPLGKPYQREGVWYQEDLPRR